MIIASLPSVLSRSDVAHRIGARGEIRLVTWDLEEATDPVAPELDAVVLPFHTLSRTPNPGYIGSEELARLGQASSARLVQLLSLGAEGVPAQLPAGAVLCNAVGVMEEQTAELACTLLLAMQREIHLFVRSSGQWANHRTPGLADSRVVLLGYGGVGSRIDRRLTGFGVEIIRVGRRPRQFADGDRVHGIDQLTGLLATADALVVSLPLTSQTQRLVDDQLLELLPDDAVVVNVGRGPVIDTQALLRELRSGRLRAALDVTDPEPLPDDHELWRLPNVMITPHVGGNTRLMPRLMVELVADQLVRLDQGLPLRNVVGEAA